ncbi:MAG: sugar transferase [Armatimonadetes bacterium]|nr:sugar transferase [Armatimonadota bacterium]
MRWFSLVIKRWIDLFIAIVCLIVFAPVLLLCALAIRWKMGPPVLFRQVRPGQHAKPFMMVKFRTMLETRDADGSLLPDWERLHPVGSFIRRLSLDELPQLWNVLKGEMSLVGPRPLLMEYLEVYTPEQARRHDVKPGITGWAQINGRQEIPFSKRLELDVWYVDHWSLALDAKILLLTLRQVLRRSGVKPGQDVRDVDDLGLNRHLRESKGHGK